MTERHRSCNATSRSRTLYIRDVGRSLLVCCDSAFAALVTAGCGRANYAAVEDDAAVDSARDAPGPPDAAIDASLATTDARAATPDASLDSGGAMDAPSLADAGLDALSLDAFSLDVGNDAFAPLDAAVPLLCPDGFVLVPGNPLYGDRDLCVSKYEMVDAAGAATSLPDGTPFPYQNPVEGEAACTALGTGYRLVTNEDWQVIARDVETVAENWRGYGVGVGGLNLGNVGTNVGGASDDAHPCDTVGQTSAHPSCTDHASEDFWFLRTHLLSSGEIIWDLGGNRAEWVTGSHPEVPRVYICALGGADQLAFGPAGDFAAGCPVEAGVPAPTYENARGMGMVEGAGGLRIQRGGSAGLPPGDAHEGLFYANTHPFWDTDHSATFALRCVYDPPAGLPTSLRLLPARTTLATGLSQTLRVRGAVGGTAIRVVVDASGGSLSGNTWTAGSTPGEDVLEVIDSLGLTSRATVRVVSPP